MDSVGFEPTPHNNSILSLCYANRTTPRPHIGRLESNRHELERERKLFLFGIRIWQLEHRYVTI